MSQTVAAERVAAEQDHVEDQHDRADADPKMTAAVCTDKKHRFDRVVSKDDDEQQRNVEKISVNVLQYQRKFSFAAIAMTRFANSACRWIGPKRFVISAAIVVTSETKSTRRP